MQVISGGVVSRLGRIPRGFASYLFSRGGGNSLSPALLLIVAIAIMATHGSAAHAQGYWNLSYLANGQTLYGAASDDARPTFSHDIPSRGLQQCY